MHASDLQGCAPSITNRRISDFPRRNARRADRHACMQTYSHPLLPGSDEPRRVSEPPPLCRVALDKTPAESTAVRTVGPKTLRNHRLVRLYSVTGQAGRGIPNTQLNMTCYCPPASHVLTACGACLESVTVPYPSRPTFSFARGHIYIAVASGVEAYRVSYPVASQGGVDRHPTTPSGSGLGDTKPRNANASSGRVPSRSSLSVGRQLLARPTRAWPYTASTPDARSTILSSPHKHPREQGRGQARD